LKLAEPTANFLAKCPLLADFDGKVGDGALSASVGGIFQDLGLRDLCRGGSGAAIAGG